MNGTQDNKTAAFTTFQGTGIVERVMYGVALAACMKAVGWGWISADDAAYTAGGIVAGIGALYAWYRNRPQAMVQAAAALPGTVVLTTPDLAKATPEANIVSNVDTKAVPK